MLVIKPRAKGSGIYDVIVRAANSALAKKVINSAVDKAATSTIAKNIINSGVTKKVLDSAVGKTIAAIPPSDPTKNVCLGIANLLKVYNEKKLFICRCVGENQKF